MREILQRSVASIALLTSSAMAADMGIKAPLPAPVPVYSWTGFYVGGNIGYSWGNAHTDLSGSVNSTFDPGPGRLNLVNLPAPFAASSSQRLNGLVGGGQIGLNYQFSPTWVWGFEFDIQGSRERGSSKVVDSFSQQICTGATITPPSCVQFTTITGTVTTSFDASIDWFGTARGRLGYLITDQVLLYGTGGVAYGQVKLSGTTSASAPPLFTGPSPAAFSASKTNVGFAVGGGIEGRFSYWLPAGWTWRLEYLYVDLGSLDVVVPGTNPPTCPGCTAAAALGTVTTHTHFTDNVVRVGLNYKLF